MRRTKIISLIAIVILAISCKKEKQDVANPNISYVSINKVLPMSMTGKFLLDIDQDNEYDFQFSSFNGYDNSNNTDVEILDVFPLHINACALFSIVSFNWKNSTYYIDVPIKLDENNTIDSSNGYWFKYSSSGTGLKLSLNYIDITRYEFRSFNVTPAKYIAIYILKNNKPYFGWIRISTADDGQSVTIYDAAISKLPNTPIKTGEK